MTLKYLAYQFYVDTMDNRPIGLARLKSDNLLCLSKFMKKVDCIRHSEEEDIPITYHNALEANLQFKDYVCQGTYWHIHLPLESDLVTLANTDISNVSIDGMVTGPEKKVWLAPDVKAHIEEQLKDSEMSAEDYILKHGHPLDMEYFRTEKQSPFATAYIEKDKERTVMILHSRCGYAQSNMKKDMEIEVVKRQMLEKRADIERLIPQLNREVISHGMLVENEQQLAEMLRALKDLNS